MGELRTGIMMDGAWERRTVAYLRGGVELRRSIPQGSWWVELGEGHTMRDGWSL